MSRRIEVELTSTRDDGTWTWRAAGAKQPKGDLEGSLLYPDAKVGDVVRADADFLMDGIVITAVLPPKGARKEPERIEIIGTPGRDDQLVTTQLAPKGRGGRDGDRRPRREGDRDRGPRPGGDRKPRSGGDRDRDRPPRGDGPGGERRPRPDRPSRPAPEPKPKPKRLRAGRVHRNAVLASLPEEQKPVAEQVLKGGIPAVRTAVEKQNESNKAEGKPEISAAPLLQLAEQIMPALRSAEWRDKAEAALADVGELDLRDLRSVVVAADAGARDEETRELAEQLRAALATRVDAEHTAWLAEIDETLSGGRVVRALRVSSRPPKAGTPFPPELAARLAEGAAASLTADTGQDRFATVLDALAYSPVRGQVIPQGIPAEPSTELVAAVKKLASRLPEIAALFGIQAPAAGSRAPRGRGKGKGRPAGTKAPIPPPPAAPAPASESTAPDATSSSGEAPLVPPAEKDTTSSEVAAETSAPETSAPEAPAPAAGAESSVPEAPEAPAPAPAPEAPDSGALERAVDPPAAEPSPSTPEPDVSEPQPETAVADEPTAPQPAAEAPPTSEPDPAPPTEGAGSTETEASVSASATEDGSSSEPTS